MKTIVVLALILISSAASASKDEEITDPRAIQAFLSDPQTHVYDMRDPVGWKSYRKLIQIGTRQSDGRCRYPLSVSTTGSYISFATEIAVNPARCQSLILEGNPGGGPRKLVQTSTQARPSAQDWTRR